MDRWCGRVAVVTGASAGIGAAIARILVEHGMTVVALARREHLIQDLASELSANGAKGKLVPRKCDLSKETELEEVYEWVDSTLGGADVVVNNAGVLDNTPLLEASTEVWRQMLDINVLALAVSSRKALNSMLSRKVDDGHIININSLLGHKVMGNLLPFYSATKWAVTALCQAFQNELCVRQSHIRITSLCPGLTRTEFVSNFAEGAGEVALTPGDVAAAVVYALSSPQDVIVAEIKLSPNTGSVGHSLAHHRAE